MKGDTLDCGNCDDVVAESDSASANLGRNLLALTIFRPVPFEAAVLKFAAKNKYLVGEGQCHDKSLGNSSVDQTHAHESEAMVNCYFFKQ